MTGQTFIIAFELGFIGRLLGQSVENDSLRWILSRQFNKSTADPTDSHGVIEE